MIEEVYMYVLTLAASPFRIYHRNSQRGWVLIFASQKGLRPTTCHLQNATEADTGDGDANKIAVLCKVSLFSCASFMVCWEAHTAWELEFWQQAMFCWQFFLRKSVRPAAPRTKMWSALIFSHKYISLT